MTFWLGSKSDAKLENQIQFLRLHHNTVLWSTHGAGISHSTVLWEDDIEEPDMCKHFRNRRTGWKTYCTSIGVYAERWFFVIKLKTWITTTLVTEALFLHSLWGEAEMRNETYNLKDHWGSSSNLLPTLLQSQKCSFSFRRRNIYSCRHNLGLLAENICDQFTVSWWLSHHLPSCVAH